MELVEGVPLDAQLAGGPLPWRFAVEVCAHVAAALAAVHARGLVHRDVKPANIMLTSSGAKVVDFGISAVAGDTSEGPGQVYGTPAYLAPERLDGGPADAASDVYALGLVLYRTLTGDLPWDADTTTQMLRAHCYVKPSPLPPIPGLPAAVYEACRRSLAKQPAARPSSAEIAGMLGAIVGSRPTLVDAPVSPSPDRTGTPRLTDIGTPARPVPVPLRMKLSEAAAKVRTALPRPRTPRSRRATLGALGVAAGAAAFGFVACLGPGVPERPAARAEAAAPAGEPDPAASRRPGCRVEYRTKADTGGQFIVDLVVANTGDAALTGWSLVFEYPGDQRLLSVSGAESSQQGRLVVLRADTPLDAGTSATVSLVGAYAAGNPMPTAFKLAGNECAGHLVGAAAPPAVRAPEPPPAGPEVGGPAGPKGGGPPGGNSGKGNSGKHKKKSDDDDDEDGDD
jgi:serine/threonine-protein kinase